MPWEGHSRHKEDRRVEAALLAYKAGVGPVESDPTRG